MVQNTISEEQLDKYFSITTEALAMAREAPKNDSESASIIIDMVERYVSDAHHFKKLGEYVLAYAALNYAHGWLDSGASTKVFVVKDNRLFTVDED